MWMKCVLEVKRKMLNEVLQCIYVISTVQCALGCGYILWTVLFLYCVLWAHVRCKQLINTLLHYSTSPKFILLACFLSSVSPRRSFIFLAL